MLTRYSIIGAGNGGIAMAGHLASQGFPVSLYSSNLPKVRVLQRHNEIHLTGAIEGVFPLTRITNSLSEALANTDVVMVTTPASAHGQIARQLAPLLTNHIVVLNPGRTGGALEFSLILSHFGKNNLVAEAQTFLYASRYLGNNSALIYRIKNLVELAAFPGKHTKLVVDLLRAAFPQFKAAKSILHTSFDNIGAVFHPAPLMLNSAKVENDFEFDHYHDGITPSVAMVMERIDAERVAVAKALGLKPQTALSWLRKSYGVRGRDLYAAIHDNVAYCGIKAPRSLNHRYITEDVPTGLVPIASFGNNLGIPTPTCDALIDLANALTQSDYRANGRTVEKLGVQGMSTEHLFYYVYHGKCPTRSRHKVAVGSRAVLCLDVTMDNERHISTV